MSCHIPDTTTPLVQTLINWIILAFSYSSIFIFKGIADGAGAVIIASEDAVKKHNFTPLARIVGYFVSGCDPSIMGIGKFVVKQTGSIIFLEISLLWHLESWKSGQTKVTCREKKIGDQFK